ncbi:hypothetical protein DRJ04_04915 [Candidatus Aerophobetes bacterium]|uniref:MmgE/PrpD family protein n=1 Tax=Aerophobetes bacterium TaxID=2030807 RepID=A0A662DBF2_UNCAE|nr:MAG: hypothetical protein DRJ04_04915 [Candidatus Aerophobetes bacterium]
MENAVSEKLARFAYLLEYESTPQSCIERIKQNLLDSIGCGIFGTTTRPGQIAANLVMELGGEGTCTLWSYQFKGPLLNVALALGIFIHSYDFDDTHNEAKLHPASAVVPAALCIAEELNSSGRDFLTALTAGYEVMIRTSLGAGPNAVKMRGWHLTGVCGTLGAAAAAGKLAGLDFPSFQSALGLAGSQSAGVWAFNVEGAMSKRLHPGRAAQSGILSVLLARKGFTGPRQILEAEDGGLCRALSDEYDFRRITKDIGKVFEAEKTSIKPYPSCRSVHSSIDAVKKLKSENTINPADIETILVYNSKVVKVQTGWEYIPSTPLKAQMSMQYNVAVAFLEHDVLPDQFTEDKLKDPQICDLARRVKVIVDPEIDKIYPKEFPSIVEVILKNGRRLKVRVDSPKGSPKNPLSYEEVKKKFLALATKKISKKRAEQVIEVVDHLESLESIKQLTALLA